MTVHKIRFAVAPSSLGAVGIAATENGVRAIEIADDEATIRTRFTERFSAGELVEDVSVLFRWLEAAVAVAEGAGDPGPDVLPLDPVGTDFQRAVWAELRAIAPGETRTYAQVAASIGRPSATRAVARACATNQLAIVIPCHRVVRSDGSLSGYRWGVERKRELLTREGSAAR